MTSHSNISRFRTHRVCTAVLIACTVFSSRADAQPKNPSDLTDGRKGKAQAESDRADELVKEGKYEEACRLYKSAQNQNPTVVGSFDLGTCYERLERINTAWNYFVTCAREARAQARTNPDADSKKKLNDLAVKAQARADALDGRRPRLKVIVGERAGLQGLVVRVDSEEWGREKWGQPLPVDPGKVTITATAPGKQGWSEDFQIQLKKEGEPAETREVKIPQLEAPRMPTQRVAAILIGGVTVGAGVLGAVFGALALSKGNEAVNNCTGGKAQPCVGSAGFSDALPRYEEAANWAHGSTASFVTAGVGAVATGILWFTAPSAASIQVSPAAGPTGASLTIRGHF